VTTKRSSVIQKLRPDVEVDAWNEKVVRFLKQSRSVSRTIELEIMASLVCRTAGRVPGWRKNRVAIFSFDANHKDTPAERGGKWEDELEEKGRFFGYSVSDSR
jgi:hypothetical protein